jgi:hypothetical protein
MEREIRLFWESKGMLKKERGQMGSCACACSISLQMVMAHSSIPLQPKIFLAILSFRKAYNAGVKIRKL